MERTTGRWTALLLAVALAVTVNVTSAAVAPDGGQAPDVRTPVDGHFDGVLAEEQTNVHVFDSLDTVCGHAFSYWLVTLTYEPVGDVVRFSLHEGATSEAHSQTTVEDGYAELTFYEVSTCAHEAIQVEGLAVDDLTRYHVEVDMCGHSPCEDAG